MVALRKIAVFAVVLPAALCGSVALRKSPTGDAATQAPVVVPRGNAAEKPRILSAGRTRIFRAGVFQMASLSLSDLAASPLDMFGTPTRPALVTPASLPIQPSDLIEPEMP